MTYHPSIAAALDEIPAMADEPIQYHCVDEHCAEAVWQAEPIMWVRVCHFRAKLKQDPCITVAIDRQFDHPGRSMAPLDDSDVVIQSTDARTAAQIARDAFARLEMTGEIA